MVEITINVFGDSHLAKNHFFQEHFSQLMQSKGTARYFYNIKYFETSAKENINVDEVFMHIVYSVFNKKKIERNQSKL
jgi:GTPase SAR1 family protein